jgi:hypothetical protein
MKRQDLNDSWMLYEAPLDCTAEQAAGSAARKAAG